jgi:putative NADH-flavin reductase
VRPHRSGIEEFIDLAVETRGNFEA